MDLTGFCRGINACDKSLNPTTCCIILLGDFVPESLNSPGIYLTGLFLLCMYMMGF